MLPATCTAARAVEVSSAVLSWVVIAYYAFIFHVSAPDDHFTPGPHSSVTEPASRRIGQAGGRPAIVAFVRLVRWRWLAIGSREQDKERQGSG